MSKLSLLAQKFKFLSASEAAAAAAAAHPIISYWFYIFCRKKIMKIAGRKFGLVRKAPFFIRFVWKETHQRSKASSLSSSFGSKICKFFAPFPLHHLEQLLKIWNTNLGFFFNFTASLDFQPALLLRLFLYFTLCNTFPSFFLSGYLSLSHLDFFLYLTFLLLWPCLCQSTFSF